MKIVLLYSNFVISYAPNEASTDLWTPNGLITMPETVSGTNSDSDPVTVVGSYDWNLNLIPCSVKTSAQCNVAIGFGVRIWVWIRVRIWHCKWVTTVNSIKRHSTNVTVMAYLHCRTRTRIPIWVRISIAKMGTVKIGIWIGIRS